jgi:serine/threonine protein kinase/tetratricopeptide (TPR) repeat protein
MSFVPGTKLGHYEIVASIGAGGMGEVYRASDTTLGRQVALKVLPADLARDPSRIERFKREARTVAALNHPHIVTLYSVEVAGDVHFLTMELVEGESLDRRLMSGPLSWDALHGMAVALADALTAAHDGGVVHRDLKPANVMLTRDGRVKILDFGIAKIADSASAASSELETVVQTSEGVVLGTMPYMSPEQVEGRPLDERTDIFSLGVMLHEMAAGTRPFRGSSPAALLSAILRDEPASLSDSRPDIPTGFARLVGRCLEKDRDQRLQTARDLRNELDAIARDAPSTGGVTRRPDGARGAHDKRSIVVLPFANLSPDAENEYFSDGLTEEIIADLSKVRALSVISRTSAMQLKGVKKDAPTIGRELDVEYVLDGSVRKSGNSLRITAQLVKAAADELVWSDKYSGTMDDVFEVQERVSREIVRALDITLTSDEHRRLAERPIANARAFELYLLARQELRRYAVDRAMAAIDEAMRIEGDTPPLLALRAWARVWQVRAGLSRDRQPLELAEREARELLARAPDASYGHSLLGHIEYERGRMPSAVHHLKRALDKAPNDSDTILMLAMTFVGAGQNREARTAAERMMACDPLSPMSWMATGVPRWFVGEPAAAIPDFHRALEIDPHNFIVHWCAGYTCAQLGKLEEARRHAGAMNTMGPDVPYTRQLLSLLDGLEGRPESARERIAAIDTAVLDAHHQFHLGESFIAAGDLDRGLSLLESSVSGFHPALYIEKFCRFLDPVRDRPRFAAYLAAARSRTDSFADDVVRT